MQYNRKYLYNHIIAYFYSKLLVYKIEGCKYSNITYLCKQTADWPIMS